MGDFTGRNCKKADLSAVLVPSLVLCAAGLSGCGTSVLASRDTNPVIQDFAFRWWSDSSFLSTTASRRLALFTYRKDASGKDNLLTCAEPPPDVGETFAKAIAAQIEIQASKGPVTAGVGGGYAEQVATAIAPLVVRSQGLQILRDSAYTLCVDYMNGWIPDPKTYMEIKQDRFNQAIKLIEKEIPYLPARANPQNAPQIPPAASAPMPAASVAAAKNAASAPT